MVLTSKWYVAWLCAPFSHGLSISRLAGIKCCRKQPNASLFVFRGVVEKGENAAWQMKKNKCLHGQNAKLVMASLNKCFALGSKVKSHWTSSSHHLDTVWKWVKLRWKQKLYPHLEFQVTYSGFQCLILKIINEITQMGFHLTEARNTVKDMEG